MHKQCRKCNGSGGLASPCSTCAGTGIVGSDSCLVGSDHKKIAPEAHENWVELGTVLASLPGDWQTKCQEMRRAKNRGPRLAPGTCEKE